MLPIIINKNPLYPLIILLAQNNRLLLYIVTSIIFVLGFSIYLFIEVFVKKTKLERPVFMRSLTTSLFITLVLFLVMFLLTSFCVKSNNAGGPVLAHYEGLYFFIAILAAIIFVGITAKMENIDLDIMFEGIFIGLIAALVSGRLFSFIFWGDIGELIKDPLSFFRIFETGGITVTGGVLGGLIAGFVYAKIKKISFLYHINLFTPAILIGQIIGRFGCFMNGDAAGKATTMPWGIKFHPNSINYIPYTGVEAGTRLHPTQLYEIIGNIILFLILMLTEDNKWIKNRRIIFYAIGYSLIRFFVEFFRNDTNRFDFISFISTGQIISLIGLTIGILLLVWSLLNDDKLNVDEKFIARAKSEE